MQLFRQIEEKIQTTIQRYMREGNYDIAEQYISLAKRTQALGKELESVAEPDLLDSTQSPSTHFIPENQSFPLFWVEGDTLRKMGANRDGKGTYIHGIPKGEFAKVIAILRDLATRQDSFNVREFVRGCGMPEYRPYLVLAALEALQLLRTPRRGLMTYVNRPEFGRGAEQAWSQLAKRPNPQI